MAHFVVDSGIAGQARVPLIASSKAIDNADALACSPTDQLGINRSVDGNLDGFANCDKGAIEFVSTVNSFVKLLSARADYHSHDSRANAGVYSIYATFINNSDNTIVHPFFEVMELKSLDTDENSVILLNTDDGTGREGSRMTESVNGDHMLSPGESITTLFEIGLESPDRFSLFVDLLGEIE